MKMFKRILLSLILVLTMTTSTFCVNYIKAEGEDGGANQDPGNSSEITYSTCTDANKCIILSEEKGSVNDGKNSLVYTIMSENSASKPLSDGATVDIKLSYSFPAKENYTFIANLGVIENIAFGETEKSGDLKADETTVGHYTIATEDITKDDATETITYLKITYEWEALKAKNGNKTEYESNFQISANLSLSENARDNEGKVNIKIGNETLSVYCNYTDSNIVNFNKEAVSDIVTEGYLYRQYKVSGKSDTNGANSNIVLKDTLSSSDVSFISNDETYKSVLKINDSEVSFDETNYIYSVSDQALYVTIASLAKDASFELTYWVKYELSKASNLKNAKNKVSGTYNNNNNKSYTLGPSEVSLALSYPTFAKEARVVSTDSTQDGGKTTTKRNVEWTITITGATYNDGYKLTDSEAVKYAEKETNKNRLTKASEVTITRTKYGSSTTETWKMSLSDFEEGKLSLQDGYDNETAASDSQTSGDVKIGLNVNDTLTIKYTNTYDITGIDTSKGLETVNTVSYSNTNLDSTGAILGSQPATYWVVPGEYVGISKSYASFDPTTNEITWKIVACVPTDFNSFVLYDNPSSNQTLVDNSLSVPANAAYSATISENTDTDAKTYENTKDFKYKINITTKDSANLTPITDKYSWNVYEYIVEYKTKIDKSSSATITPDQTKNQYGYYVKTNMNEGISKSDSTGSDLSLITSKKGETLDANAGTQIWTVTINLDVIDTSSDKEFIITDTLDENMRLIEGSFKLGGSSNSSISLTSNKDNVFVADLTEALKTYKTSNSSARTVDLTYETKFYDLKVASDAGNKSYSNTVVSKYGDDEIEDSDTGSQNFSFNPKNLLTKSYSYTNKDSTKATYTININPSGISIAAEGKETYDVKDTLGSSLSYVSDSNGKVATIKANGVDITSECEVVIDEINNTMTIKNIPDKKPITITYQCLINLAIGTNGSSLSKNQVGNDISFSGVDGIDFSNSSTFTNTVNSYKNNNTAPKSATLNVTKVDKDDTDTKLENTKFRVYRVKLEDGKLVELSDEEKEDIGTYAKDVYITTDSTGKATSEELALDVLWCVEEVEAPEGYNNDSEKVYVLFDGDGYEDNTHYDSDMPSDVTFKHIYNYIATISLTMQDTKIDEDKPNDGDNGNTEDPKDTSDNKNNSSNKKHLTCEEEHNSINWTWSEDKKTCVYRVSNTNTR